MTENTFSETTSQSWFGRLGGAFKGIIVGLIMLCLSFFLLFWNEGRAVKRHKALEEGSGVVLSIAGDRLDESNEGKLVHVTALATTEEMLSDEQFPFSEKALKLRRLVEMYQWEESSSSETKKKIGGGTETVTTYTYTKIWSPDLIDSSPFKKPAGHENPGSMPFDKKEYVAKEVTLGAFTLSGSLVERIRNFEDLPPAPEAVIPGILGKNALVHDGGYYIGKDPSNPRIGDVRVFFSVVRPTTVSLVSKQIRKTFEPYLTKSGDSINLLKIGAHSADSMFQQAQEKNKALTWILRFAGFFLMFVSFRLIFGPLSVLVDVLPILGDIVGAGTGTISFLLALILTLAIIAVAWFFYRPLAGILMLIAAGSLLVLTVKNLKKPGRQRESSLSAED